MCASSQHQREAVTHLAEEPEESCAQYRRRSAKSITPSPVQLVNEADKSILFYAKYHFTFIMSEGGIK